MLCMAGPVSSRGTGSFGGAITLTSGRCSSGCVARVGAADPTGGAVGGAITLEPIGKLGASNAVSRCGRG